MKHLEHNFTFLTFKAIHSLQDIKSYIIFRALDPLLLYLFFSTMGAAILGTEYIQFIVIGNIVMVSARTYLTSLIGMFKYERQSGTLGLNIASSTSTLELVLRRLFIPFLDSLFVMFISFLYAFFIFNVAITWSMIPSLFVFILAVLFSISAMTLIASSISLTLKNVNLFMNLVIGLMQIVCGINFPISLFPRIVQNISMNLPMTNSILGIRNILEGASLSSNLSLLSKELLIGSILFVFAFVLIMVMENLAKKTGALLEMD
jgi:ABC-2 type transport system permease protein